MQLLVSAKTDSSKASAKVKASDGQQSHVIVDDHGCKIPCGRAKCHKKKIEIAEFLRNVSKIPAQALDSEEKLEKEA